MIYQIFNIRTVDDFLVEWILLRLVLNKYTKCSAAIVEMSAIQIYTKAAIYLYGLP